MKIFTKNSKLTKQRAVMTVVIIAIVLAVIVILAVNNIFSATKKSKDKALKASAISFIKSANDVAFQTDVESVKLNNGTFEIANIPVKLDGKKPDGGYLTFSNYEVTSGCLRYGDKYVRISDGNVENISNNKEDKIEFTIEANLNDLTKFDHLFGFNRNNYPDKCYLYPSEAVQGNQLVKGAEPICRFYKRDLVSFQWEKVQVNGQYVKRIVFKGVIQTPDRVDEARPNMFVLDNTGMLFRIDAPIVSDDANESKVVGRRPTVLTTMTLIGEERNG